MKQSLYFFSLALLSTLVSIFLAGCYGIVDQGITGHLEIKKNSGWTELEFQDGKTGKSFQLKDGDYVLAYEKGVYGYRYPMIAISDTKGNLIGHLAIPRDAFRKDGSFEIYTSHKENKNSFNILGGYRKIVNNRRRYAQLKQSCTYTETYTCFSTDANGQTTMSTCTRTVSGTQDAIWEHHDFQNNYRIVFDGADLQNVAVFRAKGQIQSEDVEIGAESCD